MKFNKLVDLFLEKAKHSKAEAGYVAHTVKGQRCINCTMWRSPNRCSAVLGKISPDGWCKWWKKSRRHSK